MNDDDNNGPNENIIPTAPPPKVVLFIEKVFEQCVVVPRGSGKTCVELLLRLSHTLSSVTHGVPLSL